MTVDLSNAKWFKSSRSSTASECVEIAFVGPGSACVGVRDSKDPTGPALVFAADQWDAFLASGIWKP
ncbi:DUF397 domain-containing protein [Nocardia seriolae]|uniref:DUF397 domain-containing protein n=1 Tax=Nocardia seriolae TaxID=37332 RepID=A0ABC8B5H8_9NOCA|nr:DUF397 domain-containing protein [Nocardia seriolae]APB01588.1 hypothetical protein NS506_07568 [Nocardia seriolae]PSK26772.1 DUF397 domain-containing protein [Nocardia seriolae]QOW31437.1 DUF397 domain-containing protein [Nocardia seriolae]QUN19050.1 DUF397 domain-containing protein [Nocardia seriolae]WNJ58467.1 DUF397 domain-containing protein [Nocardia seriolae]